MVSIMLASQFALLPLMHGWIEGAIAFILVFAGALVQAGLSVLSSVRIYPKIILNTIPLAVALYTWMFVKKFEFAPLMVISTSYAFIIFVHSVLLYRNFLFRSQ